jgi:chromosomal replication initiation ATPase DnaA
MYLAKELTQASLPEIGPPVRRQTSHHGSSFGHRKLSNSATVIRI